MSVEDGFFQYHTDEARKQNPEVTCPLRIARHVLERIGVELSEVELTDFAQDLVRNNFPLPQSIDERKEVA